MGSIFLVRHATTDASVSGANLGQAHDPDLTAAGGELAARLGRAIALELAGLDHEQLRLVSSPARRCRSTAEHIGRAIGRDRTAPKLEVEDALLELDYGAWDGLTEEACRQRDPQLRASWEADPFATRAPGGESGSDVAARAFPPLERLEAWLSADPSRAAVVVSHNHVVRLRVAALLGIPMPDYRRRLRAEPGTYGLVTFGSAAGTATIQRLAVLPARGVA